MTSVWKKRYDFEWDFDRLAFLVFNAFYITFWSVFWTLDLGVFGRAFTAYGLMLLVLACFLFGLFLKKYGNSFILSILSGQFVLGMCWPLLNRINL